MPEHISPMLMAISLILAFALRFACLVVFLWVMIQIQKLNFTWLPLIGAAFLAAALDMIPLVGHFIALPALYLCIWKICKCDLYPDATFTVGLSYALTYCLTLIVLAYAPVPRLHTAKSQDDFDGDTNVALIADAQPANQVADPAPAPAVPDNGTAGEISVTGLSGGANALVTIQCGKKDYVISLGEGTTVSTDQGMVSVRFLEADGNNVKLAVNGQTVKYSVN